MTRNNSNFAFVLLLLCGVVCALLAFQSKSNLPNRAIENAELAEPLVGEGFAVVELYTSEGCSSCPPADDVLSDLASDRVFPLGFHVTYWNRLGWRDSFSQKSFDERQYNYGNHFRLNGVYTPQTIVNGAAEMVGSRQSQVKKAIADALKTHPSVKIDLTKEKTNDAVKIHYTVSGATENTVLNIAFVENNVETNVLRGENGGKTLKHNYVVRDFQTIQLNKQMKQGIVSLSSLLASKTANTHIVAFVQEENFGKILGANKIL